MSRSILACFAHPDDEAFGCAGTLIRAVNDGADLTLVCATRGEEGEISDPALGTPEILGQVREAEMQQAANTIGAREVIFLDYWDSGMAGTAPNQNPAALMNIAADEVVPRLVALIRRLRPAVVVTFDPDGGYGHPDHIAIHNHTVAAFHAAADATQYPEAGESWQADRLFYTVIVRSQLQRMAAAMGEAGIEDNGFSRFIDSVRWPEDQIHLTVDVSATLDAKWQTILCHRTQVGEQHPFRRIPEAAAKAVMGEEVFALVWPEPKPGVALTGLFAEG